MILLNGIGQRGFLKSASTLFQTYVMTLRYFSKRSLVFDFVPMFVTSIAFAQQLPPSKPNCPVSSWSRC